VVDLHDVDSNAGTDMLKSDSFLLEIGSSRTLVRRGGKRTECSGSCTSASRCLLIHRPAYSSGTLPHTSMNSDRITLWVHFMMMMQ
jgi:hypothetical protein